MASFDAVAAATAGFKIVRERPLTVFVWGLLQLIAIGIVDVIVLAPMMSTFTALAHDPTARPDPAAISRMSSMNGISQLANLVMLLISSVFYGAIFRSVLEPQKRSFASLRIGAQELWIFLTTLAGAILLVVAGLVITLVFALIGGGAMAGLGSHNAGAGAAVAVVLVLVAVGVIIWLCLRFSLGAPMSFHERGFRLFDSWALTKGHALGLFGMFLLDTVMLIGIYLVLVVVIGVVALVSGLSFAGAGGAPHLPPLTVLIPIGIVGLLVLPMLFGTIMAMFGGAFADAYRQLRPPTAEAAATFA